MSNPFGSLKVSRERAIGGVWTKIRHPDTGEDMEFLVAMAGPLNRRYMASREKKLGQGAKRAGLTSEEIQDAQLDAFVETCILDWKVKGDDGKQVEFSEENLALLFEATRQTFEKLFAAAGEEDQYREKWAKLEKGN